MRRHGSRGHCSVARTWPSHKRLLSLGDMLRFYMEGGRMHVGPEKIPALEVVSWLQLSRILINGKKSEKK